MRMGVVVPLILIAALAMGYVPADGQTASERGEILLLFISAPECCAEPEFGPAVARIKEQLGAKARAAGVAFRSVGIAIAQTGPGVRYLMDGRTSANTNIEFGAWDEIHAGGGWANQLLVQHVWRLQTVPPAFPQLIVIERSTDHSAAGLTFGPDTVLATFGGSKPILEWLAGGLHLSKSKFVK